MTKLLRGFGKHKFANTKRKYIEKKCKEGRRSRCSLEKIKGKMTAEQNT